MRQNNFNSLEMKDENAEENKPSYIVRAIKNTSLYLTIFAASTLAGTIAGGEIGERTAPPKQREGYLFGNPDYSQHVKKYALTGLGVGAASGIAEIGAFALAKRMRC